MPKKQEMYNPVSALDFTQRARDTFISAVKDPYFQEEDLRVIYNTLRGKIEMVSFCDFLKRYIYQKAEMKGNYQDIPLEQYQEIILQEFADRNTPCSFIPTTARLRNLSKNWLTQKTVSRQVVLLLGFGLGMPDSDVNMFLTKALLESRLNAKDPLEVICWYCYRYQFGYYKMQNLMKAYQNLPEQEIFSFQELDSTIDYRKEMLKISNEKELMNYLHGLRMPEGSSLQSVAALKQFHLLYDQARQLIAELYTAAEIDTSEKIADRLREKMVRCDNLYDYQKVERIENASGRYRVFLPEEIGPADLEQVILAAVPRGTRGNMFPMKESTLNEQFSGKRLNRQHIGEILNGKASVTRYDLVTLHFFIFSQHIDQYGSIRERYNRFIESTNRILYRVGMWPLYVVNAYECFLLMCVLTEDPLGSYADVWELSYTER